MPFWDPWDGMARNAALRGITLAEWALFWPRKFLELNRRPARRQRRLALLQQKKTQSSTGAQLGSADNNAGTVGLTDSCLVPASEARSCGGLGAGASGGVERGVGVRSLIPLATSFARKRCHLTVATNRPGTSGCDVRAHTITWNWGGDALRWLSGKVSDFAARMQVVPPGVDVR
jgi:hypothetical protein